MRIKLRNARVPARRTHRRGSAYLVVLGVSLIVAALAYGGILATRARSRIVTEVADASEARQYAFDAVEIAKQWIASDPNWRTNRPDGTWASDMAIGNGTFTIKVKDPLDNDMKDLPHDPLLLKITAKKGSAQHHLEVTLVANPSPLPALQFAMHTAGQLHVLSGATLNAASATVSTNNTLKNEGTVNGNATALLASPAGTVNGSLSIIGSSTPLPDSTIIDQYAAVGSTISASQLDKVALSADNNPLSGGKDKNGIYVFRPTNDFTIRNCRVLGTIVVICPAGKKVIVDKPVLLQSGSSDLPALLIKGDADFLFASGSTALREADLGVTLNPNGVPYNGSSNNSASDVFPSEIQGLVHVTGKVNFKQTSLIRGALISNSTATLLSDAVAVDGSPSIVYPPTLYTNPPCWYTTAVPMTAQRGSWAQQ